MHFEYDKVGNRLLQQTTTTTYTTVTDYQQVQTGTDESGNPIYTSVPVQRTVPVSNSRTMWYAYGAMNRQTLVDGAGDQHHDRDARFLPWRLYAEYRLAPYAGNAVAPLCPKSIGSNVPEDDTSAAAGRSRSIG
ncbi:hypothetical protein B0G57_10811 [Trinickia symbiotica]|uniref:Uncharacterized protein n=1 Tax=Trinickia symbiotica TaxID=863227 RepID=A0A2N7X2P9_9BURK|nr:hypothetical protein [Trinickia symbiotica]PMS35917.1 hypothetical protein C0Z20_16490 [Trinickia symbiotica]PPK44431.1 hypothetical protein B0G57_10811 [Trinickia symbiotica]